jgi:hypothetical protein
MFASIALRSSRRWLAAAAVAAVIAMGAGPAAYSVATAGRALNGNDVTAGPASASAMGGPGASAAPSRGGAGGSAGAPGGGAMGGPGEPRPDRLPAGAPRLGEVPRGRKRLAGDSPHHRGHGRARRDHRRLQRI